MPTLTAVKLTLYRQRRRFIPALPTSRADVHFDGEWMQTTTGQPFLIAEHGMDEERLSSSHLGETYSRWLKLSVFVDGTFQVCPRIFYQMFTIHAVVNGIHVPLVYCLLPNKRHTVCVNKNHSVAYGNRTVSANCVYLIYSCSVQMLLHRSIP